MRRFVMTIAQAVLIVPFSLDTIQVEFNLKAFGTGAATAAPAKYYNLNRTPALVSSRHRSLHRTDRFDKVDGECNRRDSDCLRWHPHPQPQCRPLGGNLRD